MIFSDMLEIAIGLSFIFMLLSLTLTSLNEMVEVKIKARGRLLLDGIEQLISPTPSSGTVAAQSTDGARTVSTVVATLYDHPLLRGLMRSDVATAVRDRQLPSYIPARNFAQALIDQALAGGFASGGSGTLPALAPAVERLRFAAEAIPNEQLRRALIGAADVAKGDLDAARAHLEQWYASATDRISGWYKRRTQVFTFVVGLALAVLLNINTFAIANRLATDSTARRAIAEQSAHVTELQNITNPAERIEALGLPIGWQDSAQTALMAPTVCTAVAARAGAATASSDCDGPAAYAMWVAGWLEVVGGFVFTALAVTLGAPFWFDVLNRLMVIRATVKPAEKSQEEGSEDRQAATGDTRVVTVMSPVSGRSAVQPSDRGTDGTVFADREAAAGLLLEDDEGLPIERDGRPHIAPSALAANQSTNNQTVGGEA